ncbi:MAG TPA: dihydrofolate reductase family protein [Allosphingosinicella sp.]|nr:dihydrofolate reductase family protein [Allosphingosinicella sp.]
MRKVVAATFVSLDGVMQAPGGPEEDPTGGFAYGGWTVDYWDQIMGEALGEAFDRPFDLLLGRRTYEIFAAHWPYEESGPIADSFNAATKYVATSSAEPLTWHNSVRLSGDAAVEVERLKQEEGPVLLIQGSSVLIQSLLARGLIDEFRLMIFPLLLGSGKRLFGAGIPAAGLRLVDSKVSSTGVVIGTYLPAGPVHTGSFARAEPSAAELARREKLRAEIQPWPDR